ncbi:hypothetical protein SBA3_320027 [Candidatus Sulfopaludibacter sp. SbA3]|nr:hypothetical protein SBA3_320027 [Candidatus Sulfopaludibacter sp. SbA3]
MLVSARQILKLKADRQQTAHHIPVKDLPESERFSRLITERKHFIDTVKLIAYRSGRPRTACAPRAPKSDWIASCPFG